MKTTAVIIGLFVLTANYLFSQQSDNKLFAVKDSGYITVDGGKLFYEIAGQGENIVLLHDGMVNREIWDEQFPVLAKNYQVVRYDRRTYGKSSDPQAPYSDIEDLNQLFIQLKIDRATVFGMSSGGGLAIDFTLKYPEKVLALVLVGAVVSGYGYSPHMTYRGGHLKSPSDLSDPLKAIKYFVWDDPYEIYSENVKAKEKVEKLLKANLHQPEGDYLKFADRPAARFLSEIKIPVLVLVGEYDIPDVHSHAGVIESGITNAKREVILNSGHLIPIEQPEAFNASVWRFLKRTEFFTALISQGVDAAVQYFNELHAREPNTLPFQEIEMNALGYRFLQQGRIKDAIELFKLNTIAFPNSGNTFDSLGEAYLKDGQTDPAISNYKKSLELDPKNENARTVLKGIKEAGSQKSDNPGSGGKNLLNKPESILFDEAHHRYLFSNYETGDIVQIDSTGKQSILVKNKGAIQGLVIVGNAVYVGARNSVRGFDLTTGEMVMNVEIEGVSNLNDVTADEAGNLYAGDVFGTKIIRIRIKDHSYSVFVDGKGISGPNGIFCDQPNNRILVCSFRKNSPVQAINLADATVTTLAETTISNCDGITVDRYGRCYVTSWPTRSIYRFDKNFKNPPETFRTGTCAPADISYDRVHNALAIPLMLDSKWEIVPITPPEKQ